jgi:hypothetical protein
MSKNVVESETVWRLRYAYWISKATRAQAHARTHSPTPSQMHAHSYPYPHANVRTDTHTEICNTCFLRQHVDWLFC